ncbi:hypothetical protein N7528_001681 [Penicillium herquei]|nr:hypothetical protein N7528_001681 [Penicillium herquei]
MEGDSATTTFKRPQKANQKRDTTPNLQIFNNGRAGLCGPRSASRFMAWWTSITAYLASKPLKTLPPLWSPTDSTPADRSSLKYWAAAEYATNPGMIVKQVSSWLVNDCEVASMVKQELTMYDWHALPTTAQPRLGWCRMMTHNLIQQVIH